MLPNRWAPWGLVLSLRDGYPVLSEAGYFQLLGTHPDAIEQVSETELYIHLDRAYRVIRPDDRAYWLLEPVPDRAKPARPAAPVA